MVRKKIGAGGKRRAFAGRVLVVALAACGLQAAGCMPAPQPKFQLNTFEITKAELSSEQQSELATILTAMFGTPDDAFAFSDAGLDKKKLQLAAGPTSADAFGNQSGLFRRHCVHCHGITGDGAGPTAQFLRPYPRDYREGMFKFKSTERAAMPTRADLRRILMEGIPGTAMPSFRLLPDYEQDALVEYVMYLSMRGQTEIKLILEMADLGEDEKLDLTREFLVGGVLTSVSDLWKEAEEKVIRPDMAIAPKPDYEREPAEIAVSIAAGRELFYGAKANCVKCHGPSSLGDGQLTDYDEWTKPFIEFAKTHPDVRPASLGLLPPRTIRPRNLRLGVYRGGSRPLDVFRRIYAGINGAPMPNGSPALSQQEIWQLVDYVRSLPFEPASVPPEELTRFERPRM
jgi:mono/diheme cytochrome c family protein